MPRKFNERIIRILCFVFIAVFSACVLANLLPNAGFMKTTLESLESSQKTVLEFSGATISASVALSALPNDFGTPVANLFAEMNKYAAFILAVVLFEKIILANGIRFALLFGVPAACLLYILSLFSKKETARNIASKIAALSLAVVLVIPVSNYVVCRVGEHYMEYVESTIEETEKNSGVIEDAAAGSEEKTVFEKLEEAFQNAAGGITDLVNNFKNLAKRCSASIAILFLNTVIAPLLVFVFIRWLLKELFSLNLPGPRFRVVIPKGEQKPELLKETEREEATV